MLTLNQLAKNQEASSVAIKKMEGLITSLNSTITLAENDASRSREYVLKTVKDAREKALPGLVAQLEIVNSAAAASGAVQRFWESKPLMLSLQTFDGDVSKDSLIRMRHALELAKVSLPLLALTFENARYDRNLALLFQCWLIGSGRSGESGFTDVCDLSLDQISIPEQQSALAAISGCLANRSYAESMASGALARKIDPVRQMTVARQQQATARMTAKAELMSD
jgi:hypothetical protein